MTTNTSGIYGFHNVANGKWYIGQSLHLTKRQFEHLRCLRKGYHRNLHFQHAFTRDGEENFEYHILETVPENMLDVRERAWISFYQSANRLFGYNKESGGNHGKHLSAETVRKMVKTLSKRHLSKEHKRKFLAGGRAYWKTHLQHFPQQFLAGRKAYFKKHPFRISDRQRRKMLAGYKAHFKKHPHHFHLSEQHKRKLLAGNKIYYEKHPRHLSAQHKYKLLKGLQKWRKQRGFATW